MSFRCSFLLVSIARTLAMTSSQALPLAAIFLGLVLAPGESAIAGNRPFRSVIPEFSLAQATEPPTPQEASSGKGTDDDSWRTIQQRGVLRVAVDPAIGPTYLTANPKNRRYEGFEWDILQAIAETLDLDLDPIYVPWGGQLQALSEAKVDLVLGGRESDGLDAQRFLATQPYYRSPQSILVRADGAIRIQGLSDLLGRKVGVVADSTGAALMEVYNENRNNAVRLFASSDPLRLVQQLRRGQLDAILLDRPVAVAVAAGWTGTLQEDGSVATDTSGAKLAIAGEPLLPTPLVGVVRADRNAVKAALDGAIAELQASGRLAEILRKWQL
jgi:polar amino acid transport system substrate-binding protein